MKKIYLDNNATTFLSSSVREELIHGLATFSGNPSSPHILGRESKRRLIKAKDDIAEYLDVSPQEIIFTSGGTEGINFLLKGLFDFRHKHHVITSSLEHQATLNCMRVLEQKGVEVTYLASDSTGTIECDRIYSNVKENTSLLFFSLANNETGVTLDLDRLAEIAYEKNILLVIDAVCALGKMPIKIPKEVSAMIFSGHKIHAPSGIGCIFLRKHLKVLPLLHGGGQESNLRGGTENLLGIIGFARAIKELNAHFDEFLMKQKNLRELFEKIIIGKIPDAQLNGSGLRNANTSNLYFPGIDAEILLMKLDQLGIAASMGSACSSGGLEPSHVLLSMGYDVERVNSSLRFSFSRLNTEEEIVFAAQQICDCIVSMRKLSQT